jgi:hypothetical protein
MFPPPDDVVLKDGPRITQHRNDLQHYPYVKIGIALAGTLFGVVHCLVWGFSFPTSIERIVWRSASLYIGLAFFSWPVSFILTSIFAPRGLGDRLFRVMLYLTLIANVIYAVARLALLDLVFRSLFPSQLAHCVHMGGRDSSFFLKRLLILSILAYRIVSPSSGETLLAWAGGSRLVCGV